MYIFFLLPTTHNFVLPFRMIVRPYIQHTSKNRIETKFMGGAQWPRPSNRKDVKLSERMCARAYELVYMYVCVYIL